MTEIERIIEEHSDHSGRLYRYDYKKLAKAIEQYIQKNYVSREEFDKALHEEGLG